MKEPSIIFYSGSSMYKETHQSSRSSSSSHKGSNSDSSERQLPRKYLKTQNGIKSYEAFELKHLRLMHDQQSQQLRKYAQTYEESQEIFYEQEDKYFQMTLAIFKRQLAQAKHNQTIELNLEKAARDETSRFYAKIAIQMIIQETLRRPKRFTINIRFVGGSGLQYCPDFDAFFYSRRQFVYLGKIPKVLSGILQVLRGLNKTLKKDENNSKNYGCVTASFTREDFKHMNPKTRQLYYIDYKGLKRTKLLDEWFDGKIIQCMRYNYPLNRSYYYIYLWDGTYHRRFWEIKNQRGEYTVVGSDILCKESGQWFIAARYGDSIADGLSIQ